MSNMNKQIIFAALGMALLAGIIFYYQNANSAPQDVVVVIMSGMTYDKEEISIKRGQTIRFENTSVDEMYWPASNIHPSHGIYPEFDPQEPVMAGKSWSFKFNKAGSWRFHDHLHPQITGTINVE